ncbi:hypothetical protein Y032_0384g405 [Ancylostoma ceylanicum]|uniref:Uncharacterized protein n=1 Tax=Ancylostoma ceylanicum TaxID=53326 RepID=A0A016RTI4_9BILA|nr:hypothetical protein Y032_0384g405 [Ancylostoma ceylanicum]
MYKGQLHFVERNKEQLRIWHGDDCCAMICVVMYSSLYQIRKMPVRSNGRLQKLESKEEDTNGDRPMQILTGFSTI